HVRAVRRPDDGVAVAVEHVRPFLRDVAGELTHEPALPRPGVTGDQCGAAPLLRGARKQRAERCELARAAGEGERRREPERAGKAGGGAGAPATITLSHE